MQKTMVQYLDDYNQISPKPMKLVLFLKDPTLVLPSPLLFLNSCPERVT